MANPALLATWFPDHKAKGPSMRTAPTFFRNLEEALDLRRAERSVFLVRSNEPAPNSIDFSTLDFLHLTASGAIRTEFLNELARNPGFELGAGGSRLLNGNNAYTEAAETEIAEFHGGESALLFHSGFEANTAIMAAIPRPGDAIVYDELIHASMHEGMQASKAPCKKSFKHNDVDSFRETLLDVLETQSLIKQGKRCVLICLESMYSMDGDVAPLRELIAVAKELFPEGNAQFLVDEAHTTGVLGRQGRGFVNELGLEDEVAIRMHTYGKALATTGGSFFINHARCFIYSTAPSFPMVAAIRAGYKLLMTGQTQALQDNLQRLVKHFFETITANPVYDEANDAGILSIPLAEDWESRPFLTQVIPVMTRQRYILWLCYHLQLAGLSVFPIDYPVVPKGKGRVRVVFHAGNTNNEVEKLAETICEWAQEMLDIEESGKGGAKIPSAARQVQAYQAAAETKGVKA
ncbi:class II aminotransferase/8-amino-7-oxononanoate synthase [Aspergillus sclerotioniger CBS 115572]|uniref:Class II aminotransferase/8-amino-7-oxononanoate synthase n=1 Tax=Aspergillus sclerotioniger CBS 115572 TaxID=1450535 RepID=A0A317WLG9_9EURO|nr:class II aminotransferase/8-amino-7-oxononanoate synthase [Aspergillus sclerotioniger CBS 115572]PWY87346.1 class II aminotransferase/8-amino-7-oxononanoate synthase [Aspergillus sclerotioniger CBS 115572]